VLIIEKDEMLRELHEEHELSDRFITHMLMRNIRIEEDLSTSSSIPLRNGWRVRCCRSRVMARRAILTVLPKVSREMLTEMISTNGTRVNLFMNKFRRLGFIQYDSGDIHIRNSLLSVVLHD